MTNLLKYLVYLSIAAFSGLAFFTVNDTSLYGLGISAGIVGVLILWWQVVLGVRQLSSIFSSDLIEVNKVHKVLGKYGFALILIHPIAMYVTYGLPPSHPSIKYVVMGTIAFTLLLIIWVLSAVVRKKISWRNWKRIHLLAYAVLALVFAHSNNLKVYLDQSTVLEILWTFMALSFIAIVVYRILLWAGVTKPKYKLVTKKEVAPGVTQFVFEPAGESKLQPEPGQFAYIQPSRFKESHPFSVAHYSEETDRLTFAIKASGKFSSALPDNIEEGEIAFIDGPYGVFTSEMDKQKKPVVIAGGIGITPFLRWIGTKEPVALFYGNQTQKDIAYRALVEKCVNTTHVLSGEKKDGKDFVAGYVSAELIESKLKDDLGSYSFYLCGPPPMMDAVEAGLIKAGVRKAKIFTERFSL